MSGTIIGIANAFGSSLTPGTVGQGQAPGPTPGSGPMNFYVTPYNSGGTSTPSGQYKLGLYSTGTYNFTVNWGDGSADDVITTWNQAEATHDYGTVIPEDRFEITITPNSISSNLSFNHWYFGNRTQGDGIKVSSIGLYGGVQFYANEDVFYGCEVLTTVNQNSSNKPTFVNKDIIDSFFYKCTNLSPSFGTVYWVGPFTGTAIDFNGGTQAGLVPTGSSNARFGFDFAPTSLLRAFKNQAQFNNQFLNNWDVSGSSDFSECFEGCLRFNSPLPWTFQTGFPVIATDMFKNAVDFNQNISSWNTSSFSRTEGMFARTLPILGSVTESVFNQNISGWDTNNVQDAESMFFNAVAFNQNLTNWFSTGSLTSITSMFQNATSFNGLVTNWDTSFVTSFASIFKGASSFNRPLSTWDTSLSLLFFSAFEGATSFNQDLSSWDVSSGLYFDNMFNGATSFVGTGLSGWNTSSSISFQGMFNGASAFNQDLSSWDISSLTNASNMLTGTAISQANWDELLIGWAVQAPNIQNGVTLSDIPVLHSAGLPSASFNKLTSAPYNWTISDLGGATPPPSFSFTVDTASTEAGSSSANQYRLPLMSTGTYDFYVDWGDGGIGNQITSWNQADATHTYASSGTYTISIQAISLSGGTPSIDHISWASQDGTTITAANDRLKVQDITAWGNAVIYLNEYVFSTCANLDITTNVAPTFGSRVLRSDAFNDCSSFAGDISSWGTQAPITGDASIFYQNGGQNPNVNFNAQLTGSLFVSFSGASNFNSSLSNWDVSSVTSLSRTFQNASSFNQNISTWDVSSVSNLSNTFNGATAFDQNLANWVVRNVANASNMFTSSGISAANWDALLIGWAAQGLGAGSLQTNVTLSDINQYHGTVDSAAIAAYNKLTAAPYNWSIVDLGELPTSAFEFDIDTAQTVTGSTNADQYRLPLMSTGTYNFTVNWGDGQSNSIATWNQADATHTYATAGLYSISITGTIDHVSWASQDGTTVTQANDRKKIKDITDWGSAVIYLNEYVFFDCEKMDITTTVAPTFGSKVMRDDQFYDCESFTGDISAWGTAASPITGSVNSFLGYAFNANPNVNFVYQRTSSSLFRAFFNATAFNNPLNNWDVAGSGGNCTDAFYLCVSFNQDISGWDMSGATALTRMFMSASSFNQNISTWDVSGADSFRQMFRNAAAFNQPIGSWTTTALDDLEGTFDAAIAFNQDLSNWDTSSVYTMQSTFEDATAFNQDLSSWDVSNLSTATNMLTNSGISAENWDKLLIGWAAQGTGAGSLQANVTLSDINQLHGSVDSAAIAAYNKLVAAPYSWTIVDLGAAVVGNLLLDTTYGSGAEAAYSVRKLRTAYTGPAIKVQDRVGSATQDIYFDANNNIDEAAIVSYGGSNDVFVETWYDQSGNSNDATQISSALRPKIYDGTSGALVKENGKVAVEFDGADDWMSASGFGTGAERSVFNILKGTADSASGYANYWIFLQTAPSTIGNFLQLYSADYDASFIGNFLTNGLDISATVGLQNQSLTTLLKSTSASNLYKDGVSIGSGSGTQSLEDELSLGRFSGNYAPQLQQEFIVYNSDKSGTDQTSIEENIGDYFTQNTPLLDTYSGAEAAYSLRLLDSTYTGFAIKVQDNVGGATQDIGFNVFGELDTVSLSQYAGSNDVFVETWYDQSGNGVNVTQGSSSRRSQIVSSGTVIVEANGKPAIKFDGSNDVLTNTNGWTQGSSRNDFNVLSSDGTAKGVWNTDSNPRFSQNLRCDSMKFGTLGFTSSNAVVAAGEPNASTINTSYLVSGEYDLTTTALSLYKNGSLEVTASMVNQRTGTGGDVSIGTNYGSASGYFSGKIQEIVSYQTRKADVRADIETNINTFYDIYTEPVAPLLLNNYPGAAAAYSLRRIDSSYKGSAVLVQTTNNTKGPVYIGFDSNNDLDTVSLAAYGGSEEVVVAGWLDQSGNGNDAIQNSASARPVIYRDSTATTPGVVTENGKPAVEFDGSNYYFNLSLTNTASDYNAHFVIKHSTTSLFLFDTQTGRFLIGGQHSSGVYYDGAFEGTWQNFTTQSVNSVYAIAPTSGMSYQNGTQINSGLSYSQKAIGGLTRLGSQFNTNAKMLNGTLQEFILYADGTDRTDIEENIGGYYDIVLPGILDENPGAAAAYSLRRLSSTYTGSAIQVQRADNVGGTTDIGFDGYGDLDTAALTTAAAGNDMVVATWYDQSGNGNDATQGTSANRPKIYDGSTGVVQNTDGKLACDFNTSTSSMGVSNTFFIGKDVVDMYVVLETNDTGGIMFGCAGSEYIGYLGTSTNRPDSEFGTPTYYVDGVDNSITTRTEFTTYVKTGVPVLLSIENGDTQLWGDFQSTLGIGSYAINNSLSANGKYSEIIIYDSSSNRTDIEENIGGYYDIPLAGLLDENPGAAAAYSLRRLRQAYTGSAIQVQRADNVGGTTDIGFDSYGELDTTALTTAAQGNDMVVVTLYDQSGNSNDATQGTSTARPKIYDGQDGVVTENGKPAVSYNTSSKLLQAPLTVSHVPLSVFIVQSGPATQSDITFDLGTTASSSEYTRLQSNAGGSKVQQLVVRSVADGIAAANASDDFNQGLITIISKAVNDRNISVNGGTFVNLSTSITTVNSTYLKLGGQPTEQIKQQDVIVYNSDQSDNRLSIEDNVGDYYGIEIAGLLDQYSGAAAGYSLRKLSNSYTGFAVKVQDTVGGATQDIGFNADGELDTVALAQYGGSNDVFVETWYDQSGNGYDATQGTSLNRPKIYDGATAAVLTQNGKPTVDFRGSATVSLSNASFKLNPTPFSMFTVAQFPNVSDVQALVDQSEGNTAGLLFRKNGGTNEFRFWYYPDLPSRVLGVDNSTAQSLRTLMLANGEQLYRLDGTQGYSAGAAVTNNPVPTYDFVIGRDQDRADRYFQGNAQELIFYLSNEKDNFTGIEDNINFFYDIY